MLKREGFRPIEDWQFVIAGWDEVNYLDAIKAEAANAGIQAQVTIAGPLHGAEKESTLGNVDAFVLPSYSEGLPMAVLEAWSWGLPTLITPECNLEIAFERGAALKISNDPARLAADLRTFFGMTVDERTRMGRAALDLVNEKFSWGEIATDLERVYAWMKNKTAAAPSCVRLT
jgi:poly(glycerol-phosphate) alpha-glucosyltransferase